MIFWILSKVYCVGGSFDSFFSIFSSVILFLFIFVSNNSLGKVIFGFLKISFVKKLISWVSPRKKLLKRSGRKGVENNRSSKNELSFDDNWFNGKKSLLSSKEDKDILRELFLSNIL